MIRGLAWLGRTLVTLGCVAACGCSDSAAATSPVHDLTWDALWYDSAGRVHLAVRDTLGLLSDGDEATGLYAYHSANRADKGNPIALESELVLDATSAGIDITRTHYFWVEARAKTGSLFSLRELSPANAVRGLVATQHGPGLDLSWIVSAKASGYEISYGTSRDLGHAIHAGASTINSTTLCPLAANTGYWVWVRATSAGIGGNGFPSAFASVPAETSE